MKKGLLGFLELAHAVYSLPGTALLYSGSSHDSAQNSYLCFDPEEEIIVRGTDAWDQLKHQLGALNGGNEHPLWVGYFTYEMDIAHFIKHKSVIHYSHETEELYLIRGNFPEIPKKALPKVSLSHFSLTLSKERYLAQVEEIREEILNGNVYQACLTHALKFERLSTLYPIFLHQIEKNPSPFSAYLNYSTCEVASNSPERFLSFQGGELESRPMKGTGQCKETLLASDKEKAELAMIVDLVRHDLSGVSVPGSVKVKEFRHVEAYQNLFQTISIIQSEALNLHPIDLIKNCFPAGSITGCPKRSAIQLLKKLEKRNRGIYTGSIGYFSGNGSFDFNVAIRTLHQADELLLQLGGGITFDSNPLEEYEETLLKGRSFLS